MTPDRWRQIERWYHAALEHGAGVLADADPDVRREVEAMLAEGSRGAFLDQPTEDLIQESTKPPLTRGSSLGPYLVEALLGAGGMGEVFSALDTRLGRRVAIKTSRERFGARFEREARAISSLNHPHICTLYDVGPHYLVMELVEGETLANRLKQGALPIELTLRYGAQIADALATAHAKGIVHRDLKPANIMVTRHGVKVLDFGLAKWEGEARLTGTNVVMGTPAYMAPEQVEGTEADARTDLFALGLVLYEMAAGRLPFPDKSLGRMIVGGSVTAPPRLVNERADVPETLDALVAKLLEKEPARRFQSAEEVARELSALADRPAAPVSARGLLSRPAYWVPAALTILLAIAGGVWLYLQSQQRRWAREDAVPEINRLVGETKPVAAYLVLEKAEQYLPGDPQLAKAAQDFTRFVSVSSSTPQATVEIQDYLFPDGAWLRLGATPLPHVRIPKGYLRWRISRPGAGEYVAAPEVTDSIEFPFEPAADTPAGMVHINGGPWHAMIGFTGWLGYQLPAFDIDRFEVTNREYQKFVDAGGYRKREYWKEKFVKDGKELTWEQAMDLLRDPTRRPGPSTWEAGHFPTGQADYPVSGVSWYEASAYTAFVGKTLPSLGEWFKNSPAPLARYTTNRGNFAGKGPAPVGASQAVGPFGAYDMIGNVREWCLNTVDSDKRFILGGAWGTRSYQAYDPEALPPFDRSALNGFRGVRNREPLSAGAAAAVVRRARDFSKVKPATDDVFRAYRAMYAYDKQPLNPKADGAAEETPVWTKQKITIDAGYGGERLPLYLFLPKHVHPPYQAVVFFPSADVNFMPNSRDLGDLQLIDYVIKSGRVVAYPIYQGTYERRARNAAMVGEVGDRELTIQQSKEVRRSVDYLETRPDIIDKNKLAYLGVSQGAAMGVIFTALEDRFAAVIFLSGGYFLGPPLPGRDQADFAPRLKKPVLMVNGKYDYTFPPDQAQLPMFEMIGTDPANKVREVFDTPHNLSERSADLSRDVLAWLDKYLGRVN